MNDLESSFISFDEKPEVNPIISPDSKRNIQRVYRRAEESLMGLPGDVVQFARGISGIFGGPVEEESLNVVQRAGRNLVEKLPTSAEFRARGAEEYPELEPQSEFEELQDEITSDFATLALPVKGKVPFARALGLSVAGNLGKEVVKSFNLGPEAQDATKLGLMVFGGMFGKGRGIQNHINNLYKRAASEVPQGATFKYPSTKVDNLANTLRKGTMNDAKQSALTIIEDIDRKTPSGVMTVEEGIQFDQDINRAIRKAGGDKQKKTYLKQLKNAHSQALNNYAKENPTWGETYNEAKQAYQGIATSIDIQDYIKRNASLKNLLNTGILLGLEETYLPGNAAMKLGGVGATGAAMYMGEVSRRIAKNPALRRYYQNVINASLDQNKAMLLRNLEGLERVAKKEFENDPLPIYNFLEE